MAEQRLAQPCSLTLPAVSMLSSSCSSARQHRGGWGGSLSTAGSAAPRTPRSTQPGAAQLTQVRHGAPLNGRRL